MSGKQQALADADVAKRAEAKRAKIAADLPADQAVVMVRGQPQVIASDAQLIEKLERLIRQNPEHPKVPGWKAKLAALKG